MESIATSTDIKHIALIASDFKNNSKLQKPFQWFIATMIEEYHCKPKHEKIIKIYNILKKYTDPEIFLWVENLVQNLTISGFCKKMWDLSLIEINQSMSTLLIDFVKPLSQKEKNEKVAIHALITIKKLK